MKKPELWRLILRCLLPGRNGISFADWQAYVNQCLVPEMRLEVLRYYGENTSLEATFPGLDYTSKSHRLRLEAFPRHRQLFRILNRLRLTEREIRALCIWEGTLAARNHYELLQRAGIIDTTWDGVVQYVKPVPTSHVLPARLSQRGGSGTPSAAYELGTDQSVAKGNEESRALEEGDAETMKETEGEAHGDPSADMNQRLMEGTVDADWEQWMKEALERGDIQSLPEPHFRALQSSAHLSNQNQTPVQSHRTTSSTPPSHNSSLTSSQVDQQPQRDFHARPSNDDILVTQLSYSSLSRPTRPLDQVHEISYPPGFPSSQSVPSARLTSQYSNNAASLLRVHPATNHPLGHLDNAQGSFRQREDPEISSDNSNAYVAALQDSLLHPTQYNQFYPSARVISASASGPDSVAPSATPSTSVPS